MERMIRIDDTNDKIELGIGINANAVVCAGESAFRLVGEETA